MVETAKKQWYVLHTYSGFEDKVRSDLLSRAQSLGMQDYIFRVVVPQEQKVENVRGKKEEVSEKVFPGYVLVEMVMTDESWFVVRNTPNVTGFVGSHGGGSKPSPLYDDEVAAILQMQGEPAKKKRDIHFEVGESVKITEGAFNGMVGKISDIQEDKEKLYLTIDMFGHATTAELDYDQVDKIDD
ncbi:Transcription antitermination protein nusG [Lactobacillus equicursoris DSM 19284 = JCM 14600 = CIP 110162]|uniref:Transcription termination/antitermination protein NusG n=3 Tax=Lactobacillus equicursoris TaxID=420645 RepID=K0NZ27_9LACO|nr:transcription termination/antitermination protein NusG [Lactobacillus equicursoris]KRL02260.1 transcription antitermination protein nusG [Lactobacillus equicursoris DSM 19284 = JCM 14600 = CIP 110162]MDD6385931.1 transcription termination/antitermination protein NusG [Lactobacillus equicursoris]MDD6406529.1 transcription termination/antitermination protein NusG [Lactobacillus equicursoris]MST80057.1 transcription termination/antitermination protein NusG [Lactobacillus equicursoris]CCK83282.